MWRQLPRWVVLCLCATSSLAAQTIHFSPRQDIQTNATHLTGLAVADFNGDKKLDIVVTDDFSQTVSVYLNDGTGKFGSPVTSTFTVPSIGGFGSIVAGDVNEDGKQDLIIGPVAGTQYDVVLFGNGDGTFTEKDQIAYSYGFTSAALVDINNDKHLDLIAGGNGNLSVYLGDGAGNFTPQQVTNPVGGDLYTGVTVGDFNSDGTLDFVVASYFNDQLMYYPGNGDGSFKPASTLTVQGLFSPGSIVSADLNGDGKLDLLVGSADVALLIPGNGDGTFQTSSPSVLPLPVKTNFAAGISPVVAAADMNGDKNVDVVAADNGSDTLNVLLNDGSGYFTESINAALDDGTGALEVPDLNGDGLPDIVLINYKTQKISYFLSTPAKSPANVSILSSVAQALVGSSVAITVQVKSLGSHTPTGTVTLASGSTSLGQQTLTSNGQVGFTLPTLPVGQYPLIASYSGDTYNNAASNTPALVQDITDFQFTLSSSTQTVGIGTAAAYSFTVTPLEGFAGPVTFSCAGLPAGYGCSSSSVSVNTQAVSGVISVSPPTSAGSTARQSVFRPGAVTFLAFGCICYCGRRRQINLSVLSIIALAAIDVAASGCGGGSEGSKPSQYTGTTNFTVTATTTQGAVTVTHEAPAILIVQ